MKRFWLSWYGTFQPKWAWCSGSVGLTGNLMTLIAIVDAPSQARAEAWARQRRGYKRDRFAEEQEPSWTPILSGRFTGPFYVYNAKTGKAREAKPCES